ncbi:MAG: acyl--CoA ligase [Actinobacteria bacterium]|nr:acyl--CoA ligase [Actinomycetota bacterium]
MRRLTAAEAEDGARYAAAGLLSAGVVSGQRVTIDLSPIADPTSCAEQHANLIKLVLGMLRTGVVPVLVNPLLSVRERSYVVVNSEPTMVISNDEQVAALLEARSTLGTELSPELIARPMHYTSGTTGTPKGVWTGFLPNDQLAAWWADELEMWGFDSSDSTLVHGPLAHSGPLRFALLMLIAGGSVLLPGGFNPERISRALAVEKPTAAFVVPTHLQRLLDLPDLPESPYRRLAHAGSTCPPDLKRRIHAWAGLDQTWEFYGSSEGQFTSCTGREWEERPGTLGHARAGRDLFIDEGTIWCETPDYTSFEYWKDPEKTAAAWRSTSDGRAFTVGDLGRLDDDGYLYLDGRREDLIISGGVNVYPAQVEHILLEHPLITDAAVFGVEDEQWGQRVCAAIVCDASSGPLTDSAVEVFVNQLLAPFQRPKTYLRLDELPRNVMGKVLRNELRQAMSSG